MKRLTEQELSKIFPNWAAVFYAAACGFLIPWTLFLGFVLPTHYVSDHWDIVWAGFDVLECLLFAFTAVLVVKRSPWTAYTSIMLGTTLLIDAWFDLLTARSSKDFKAAFISAIFLEIPISLISFLLAHRIFANLQKR
jgi:hypothetical protein